MFILSQRLFSVCLGWRLLPDEQKLINNLGLFDPDVYDKSVRPVYNSTWSVVVDFGFTLIQIVDMVSRTSYKSLLLKHI
jgi:hypothetical protein